MLPPYPPSLLSARGGAPERRGAPAPGSWDAAASPKTRVLCGARSRPLPLAARPFPFLPLLLRFHPHPSPSLRELAGHPPAVHLVPFTPRVKEWGANWDVDLCCWRVPCQGGLLGRRWRLILHGSRGWESFDQQHSVHLGPRL